MKKTIVISVRLNEDEYIKLSAIAKANMDSTISSVARFIIRKYLDDTERSK